MNACKPSSQWQLRQRRHHDDVPVLRAAPAAAVRWTAATLEAERRFTNVIERETRENRTSRAQVKLIFVVGGRIAVHRGDVVSVATARLREAFQRAEHWRHMADPNRMTIHTACNCRVGVVNMH